jgi:ABC-type lipoprotein release transport system permease subunit
LQGELRAKLLGAIAHIYLTKAAGFDDYQAEVQKLRQMPGVEGAGPAVRPGTDIDQSQRRGHHDQGIDPALEGDVTDIRTAMRKGRIEDLAPRTWKTALTTCRASCSVRIWLASLACPWAIA